MATSISSVLVDCLKRLNNLTSQAEVADRAAEVPIDLWADELGRLRVWAANIGAHQTGQSSLDYRLRDASHIKAQTVKLLERLRRTLDDVDDLLIQDPDEDEALSIEDDDDHDDDTELQQIYKGVVDTIDCLFRLSMIIRRPAQHDKLLGTKKLDATVFEPFDRQHVANKHPKAGSIVADRLGAAISRRRAALKYRERHHAKLAKAIERAAAEPIDRSSTGDLNERRDAVSTLLSHTIATEFKEPHIDYEETASNSGISQTSYAPSLWESSEKITVPHIPRDAAYGKAFECPYCFFIITPSGRRAWTRHVFKDLMPYICVFPDCSAPNRLYDSRHDWFQHLRTKHISSVEPATVDSCPLQCGADVPHMLLERHLGRHLEELALFALPRADAGDEERSKESQNSLAPEENLDETGSASSDEVRAFSVGSSAEQADVDYTSRTDCSVITPYDISKDSITVAVYKGTLRQADRIVLCGHNAPIATTIEALSLSRPVQDRQARLEHGEFDVMEIKAKDLATAVEGSRLIVVRDGENEETLMRYLMAHHLELQHRQLSERRRRFCEAALPYHSANHYEKNPNRTLEHLKELIMEGEKYPGTADQLTLLRKKLALIDWWRARVNRFLAGQENASQNEIDGLLWEGRRFKITMPELTRLEDLSWRAFSDSIEVPEAKDTVQAESSRRVKLSYDEVLAAVKNSREDREHLLAQSQTASPAVSDHKDYLRESSSTVNRAASTDVPPAVVQTRPPDPDGLSFQDVVAEQESNDADRKFPCPNCTHTYLHAKHLKRHMLRHTGDRPYMCVLCNDTFSRSDILKRHFQKCSVRRGNPTGATYLSNPAVQDVTGNKSFTTASHDTHSEAEDLTNVVDEHSLQHHTRSSLYTEASDHQVAHLKDLAALELESAEDSEESDIFEETAEHSLVSSKGGEQDRHSEDDITDPDLFAKAPTLRRSGRGGTPDVSVACIECRERKVKCVRGLTACQRCTQFRLQCSLVFQFGVDEDTLPSPVDKNWQATLAGEHTAWSATVIIQNQKYTARNWYDGRYLDNARNDAAKVALTRLHEETQASGLSKDGFKVYEAARVDTLLGPEGALSPEMLHLASAGEAQATLISGQADSERSSFPKETYLMPYTSAPGIVGNSREFVEPLQSLEASQLLGADIVLVRYELSKVLRIEFPPYSISEKRASVGQLRDKVAQHLQTDRRRVRLVYQGRDLEHDSWPLRNYSLKQNSEAVAVETEEVLDNSAKESHLSSQEKFSMADSPPRRGASSPVRTRIEESILRSETQAALPYTLAVTDDGAQEQHTGKHLERKLELAYNDRARSPLSRSEMAAPGQDMVGLTSDATSPVQELRYQCEFPDCGQKFARDDLLDQHELNHGIPGPFICPRPECQERFYRFQFREWHLARHAEEDRSSLGFYSSSTRTAPETGHSMNTADVISPEDGSTIILSDQSDFGSVIDTNAPQKSILERAALHHRSEQQTQGDPEVASSTAILTADEEEVTSTKDGDSTPGFQQPKAKGILKKSRQTTFPEDPNPLREGVAPLKDAQDNRIPPNARWTKVSRALVNPEALEQAHERFEEQGDYVIILRVVSKEEIEKLVEKTREIRRSRPPSPPPTLANDENVTNSSRDLFDRHPVIPDHDSQVNLAGSNRATIGDAVEPVVGWQQGLQRVLGKTGLSARYKASGMTEQTNKPACGRVHLEHLVCDKCRRDIVTSKDRYYHCCFCASDDFDHCLDCGPECPKHPEHPRMSLYDQQQVWQVRMVDEAKEIQKNLDKQSELHGVGAWKEHSRTLNDKRAGETGSESEQETEAGSASKIIDAASDNESGSRGMFAGISGIERALTQRSARDKDLSSTGSDDETSKTIQETMNETMNRALKNI